MEETELVDLRLIRKLGKATYDKHAYGLAEIHECHYFKLGCQTEPAESWIAYETTL